MFMMLAERRFLLMWCSVSQTSSRVVSIATCVGGDSVCLGPRITRPAYKLLTITQVAYKDILFFSHARVLLSL